MPFQVVMFSYAYCYYISLHIQYVCLDTHAHSSSHMQTIQKRSAFCWRLMDVTWSGVLSHNTSLLRLLRGRSPDNASSISCVLERRIVPFIESSIVQFHTGIRIYSVVILANRCICVLQYYSAQNGGNFTVDGVTSGQVEKVMWSSASVCFFCVHFGSLHDRWWWWHMRTSMRNSSRNLHDDHTKWKETFRTVVRFQTQKLKCDLFVIANLLVQNRYKKHTSNIICEKLSQSISLAGHICAHCNQLYSTTTNHPPGRQRNVTLGWNRHTTQLSCVSGSVSSIRRPHSRLQRLHQHIRVRRRNEFRNVERSCGGRWIWQCVGECGETGVL